MTCFADYALAGNEPSRDTWSVLFSAELRG